MVNRWEKPHDSRSRVPASLQLLTFVGVVVAGVTTAPLHAQPGACERPTISISTSSAGDRGGTTSAAFDIAVDIGGDDYCFWEITYQTGGGNATPGEDYRPIEPTTECRSGNDSVTGSVDILGATDSASDISFEIQVPSIRVGGCTDGQLYDVDESATISLRDLGPSGVSIDDVQVEEGDSGTTDAVFTVSVAPPPGTPISVRFQTESDTATVSDGDYKAQFGSVTVSAESEAAQATISVPVVGDTRDEEDETFVVLLTSAEGAEIADGEGIGTIVNDDEPEASESADTARADVVAEAAASESTDSAKANVAVEATASESADSAEADDE